MGRFANWYCGKPVKPRGEAIRFMQMAMPDLARRAAKEGWLTHLLGFVQYQHRKPVGEQVARLISDHEQIDALLAAMDDDMARRWKRAEVLEARAKLKQEVLAPMQAVAA